MTIPMQWALRRRMMMAVLGVDVAALSITYTGAHTDYGMVTMSDGARYRLLAFTASGTLSIEQPVNCEVCVVGGGANGGSTDGYGSNGGFGGAGAYLKNQSVSAYNGGSVVIGAGQGVSSIAGVSVNAVSGKNGGTGAGGTTAGTGDGISKYPFEDTGYSLWASKPHCAGGGAGGSSYYIGDDSYESFVYGDGGSNGSNGSAQTFQGTENAPGGSGGLYGGGNGGKAMAGQHNGANATYYGSGGGGGAYEYYYSASIGSVGVGYQGIIYIRIPEDQAA